MKYLKKNTLKFEAIFSGPLIRDCCETFFLSIFFLMHKKKDKQQRCNPLQQIILVFTNKESSENYLNVCTVYLFIYFIFFQSLKHVSQPSSRKHWNKAG